MDKEYEEKYGKKIANYLTNMELEQTIKGDKTMTRNIMSKI